MKYCHFQLVTKWLAAILEEVDSRREGGPQPWSLLLAGQQPLLWFCALTPSQPLSSVHKPITQALRCPSMSESDWDWLAISFCQLGCLLCMGIALCSTWIWDTKMLTLYSFPLGHPHASSPALLSPVFQYFWVPNRSAKPCTIACEIMCILFFF